MTYAELAETLKTSIKEYECDDKGHPNGYVICRLTEDELAMAVGACRMRADLIERMKSMIRALEV